jgi:hypothetical protein
MSNNELLDSILIPLAELFEMRQRLRKLPVSPSSPEEWEPLRDLLAHQFAEGLMLYSGTRSWNCELTPKGYATHLPRIRALRVFGGSKRT